MFEFPLSPSGGGVVGRGDDTRAEEIIAMARVIAVQGRSRELAMLDPAGRGARARPFDWAGDLLARSGLLFSFSRSGRGVGMPSYGAHTRHCLKIAAGLGKLAAPCRVVPAILQDALPDLNYKPWLELSHPGWLRPRVSAGLAHDLCQSLSRSLYDGLCEEEDFLTALEAFAPAGGLSAQSAQRALAELIEATGQLREPEHVRALSPQGLDRAFAAFKVAAPGLDPQGALKELDILAGAPWKEVGLPSELKALALRVIETWVLDEHLATGARPPSKPRL